MFLSKEADRLEAVWEPLRWTKRLLKATAQSAVADEREHHHDHNSQTPKALQQAAVHHYASILNKGRKIVRNISNFSETIETMVTL